MTITNVKVLGFRFWVLGAKPQNPEPRTQNLMYFLRHLVIRSPPCRFAAGGAEVLEVLFLFLRHLLKDMFRFRVDGFDCALAEQVARYGFALNRCFQYFDRR